MSRSIISILTIFVLLNIFHATAQPKQVDPWPKIENQMKPWTRWWWMGSTVDEKNLSSLLNQYQQAGLGGVEITPIYGAVGFEDRYISFLSPDWMNMLQFTVKKANTLGLGVDMNTGTGWPFGGPQIKPEQAATRLITQKYTLNAGTKLNAPIRLTEKGQESAKLVYLAASNKSGATIDLMSLVNAEGLLSWSPESECSEILAVFAGKTKQLVKRAAPGGEGFTLDHLDKAAVDIYLKRFNEAFAGKPQGLRAFFNDSYEVYGANWTPTFLHEFQQRRGYDLRKYLPQLISKDTVGEQIARIKSDYRETMSELLLDNFTENWTSWAHQNKALTKNQSHGSPGNLLDLYGAVDIPETETYGSSFFPIPGLRRDKADIRNVDPDPFMSKFASSAANTGGKKLVASETFTWLSEHFKTSYSQCKPEAEQMFLAGVNHIFYHGSTYSPEDVAWPGWLFYASVQFNPTNSLWPHASGLNNYIARCQSVLQSGKADNELLIYWPVYDVWNKPKGMEMPLQVHNVDEWLHPTPFYKLAELLKKDGYSFDFASDKLLAQSKVANGLIQTSQDSAPYKVVVVPESEMISLSTLHSLLILARNGATVIFQKLPKDVPGLNKLDERRSELKNTLSGLIFSEITSGLRQANLGKGRVILSEDMGRALRLIAIEPESLTKTGLQFIRRSFDGGKYYYLVNHTATDIDSWISVNQPGSVLIMDPQTGSSGNASRNAGNQIRVQLKAGETWILKITAQEVESPAWKYLSVPKSKMEFKAPWSVHFKGGGPEIPEDKKMTSLTSWTSLADSALLRYSGTAEYTSTFDIDSKKGSEYVLNLGKVHESARVWINGHEVGILWSIPFEARVGKYLKSGKNTIKVEVVNLMANRIRDMDRKKILWRNYHEINFVTIDYKPFDASGWEVMPSGLLGPVTITNY